MFNSTIVLDGLLSHDRILFQVKDFGMLTASAFGGMLGPRVIATASLGVVESFSSYLELEPSMEIAGNGPPLLQVVVRFGKVSLAGIPEEGNTDILTQVFGSRGVSSVYVPSAPPPAASTEQAITFGGVEPVPEPETASALVVKGSLQSVEQMPPTSVSGSPDVLPQLEVSGRQEVASAGPSAGSSSDFPSWWTASSAVFFIDGHVYDFAPRTQWVARIKDLSDKGQTYPFPNSPGRNFNVLAAGWDWELKDYVPGSTWETPSVMCEDDEVYEQLERFVEKNQTTPGGHWCRDVWVLMKFLEHTKVPLRSSKRLILCSLGEPPLDGKLNSYV